MYFSFLSYSDAYLHLIFIVVFLQSIAFFILTLRYKNGDAAKRAMVQVNGQELAGRPLKISLVSGGHHAMEDDDGGGVVSLDSSSRHVLMSKLARDKGVYSSLFLFLLHSSYALESMAFADKLTVATSNCLQLKNMFSPNDPEVHA